jgi:hypothetical protein
LQDAQETEQQDAAPVQPEQEPSVEDDGYDEWEEETGSPEQDDQAEEAPKQRTLASAASEHVAEQEPEERFGFLQDELPPALAQKAKNVLDEDVLGAIDELIQYRAGQIALAQVAHQQSLAALRLPREFADEYQQELLEASNIVPPGLRGTRDGARLAVTAAIHRRIQKTGDMAGEFERAATMLRSQQGGGQPARTVDSSQPVRQAGARSASVAAQPASRQPVRQQPTAGGRMSWTKNRYGLTDGEIRALMEEA